MGGLIALDEALERLLTDASYRAAFLAGRTAELGLAPADLAALEVVDRDQLVATARRLRGDLLGRRCRGSGGLRELYPGTLAAWREAHPGDPGLDELMDTFLASPAYRGYREVPYVGPGTSLEEAFFRFAEGAEIGTPAVREREFVVAVAKALLVSPEPSFRLPDGVERTAHGYVLVARRTEPPYLAAAVAGRLVQGPVTPFLADLLDAGRRVDKRRAVAEHHGLGPAALQASLDQLGQMALL